MTTANYVYPTPIADKARTYVKDLNGFTMAEFIHHMWGVKLLENSEKRNASLLNRARKTIDRALGEQFVHLGKGMYARVQ